MLNIQSCSDLIKLSFNMTFVSTGEKNYHCKVCGKNWGSKGALNEHMMVHSNERPWQCTECGTCFKKNSALKKHMVSASDFVALCTVRPATYKLWTYKERWFVNCSALVVQASHQGLRTKCQHCGEEFPSHYQCRRHELNHR